MPGLLRPHHHQEGRKIMALGIKARNRAERGICDRTAFTAGNMSGQTFAQWSDVTLGSLPHGDRPSNVSGPVYVVFSYRTPIAWYADGVWTVPNVRYSMTTTHHQNITRVELSRTYGV